MSIRTVVVEVERKGIIGLVNTIVRKASLTAKRRMIMLPTKSLGVTILTIERLTGATWIQDATAFDQATDWTILTIERLTGAMWILNAIVVNQALSIIPKVNDRVSLLM